VIGRWQSRDPIGEDGGINLYGYVGNKPIDAVDLLGLSSLDFDRGNSTLTIRDNSGNILVSFPAANNTTSTCKGPWPNGTYPYAYYNRHPESGATGPYGLNGIFVFDVPDRPGIGVHSGRACPQSKTLGCVRTTDTATSYLRTLNSIDPIKKILIH
jgi:uncharacterized protein RhaS with RHS repeats